MVGCVFCVGGLVAFVSSVLPLGVQIDGSSFAFQRVFLRKGQILKTICFTACHFPLEGQKGKSERGTELLVWHECVLVHAD